MVAVVLIIGDHFCKYYPQIHSNTFPFVLLRQTKPPQIKPSYTCINIYTLSTNYQIELYIELEYVFVLFYKQMLWAYCIFYELIQIYIIIIINNNHKCKKLWCITIVTMKYIRPLLLINIILQFVLEFTLCYHLRPTKYRIETVFL